MTASYEEHPDTGYFNCWSGTHPTSAVRKLDLYLVWRDGDEIPPLDTFENLTALITPAGMLDAEWFPQVARSNITDLQVMMSDGEFPNEIFELPRLEKLDLSGSGNRLTSLPDRFDRLPRLRVLNVSHHQLRELPPSVTSSRSIVDIDASYNELAVTPVFPRTSPVTRLILKANPLETLTVEHLPVGLEELDVAARLTVIPSAIGDLVALRRLAIANRGVREIPDLSRLGKLIEIELPDRLGEAAFDRLPPTLEAIRGYHAGGFGLDRVPPSIGRFTRLRELWLQWDPITELPAVLRDLPLETLRMSHTRLGDTPSYDHLPDSLRHLELAGVGMTRLPDRLTELTQLRKLQLAGNRLAVLPASLGRLTQLEELDLDSNCLTALPAEIGALTQLRELGLRSNQLTALPATLGELRSLVGLDVVQNQLTTIPPAVRKLPCLRILQDAGNPIVK